MTISEEEEVIQGTRGQKRTGAAKTRAMYCEQGFQRFL
jgi:hypothetical protein